MSYNIASVLGYGTPIYLYLADLFSKKQSSGTANESTSVMEKEDVSNSPTGLCLQLKLNKAFQAIRLTFQTLSVLLRYSNFPNTIPGIYISLAFL